MCLQNIAATRQGLTKVNVAVALGTETPVPVGFGACPLACSEAEGDARGSVLEFSFWTPQPEGCITKSLFLWAEQ